MLSIAVNNINHKAAPPLMLANVCFERKIHGKEVMEGGKEPHGYATNGTEHYKQILRFNLL